MESFLRRIEPVWQPHPGQAEFLRCEHKIKVLACGRRWGKTEAVAAQVVASLFEEKPTRHLLLAPTLDQATILFDRVVYLLDELLKHESKPARRKSRRGASAKSRQRRSVALPEDPPRLLRPRIRRTPYPYFGFNGHRVAARSGHVGRLLRGNEASHIVIDEAAFVPEELVTEVAMPMLATTDGLLTLISTPHGFNHFWRFFDMGREGINGVWSRTAPTAENPLVKPSFLEIQRSLISERSFAIEYEAQFLDDKGRIFKADAIDRCLVPRFKLPHGPPYAIGIDWARYSDYTTVVIVCQEGERIRLVDTHRFNLMPWRQIMDRVVDVIAMYPSAPVVVDETSIGSVLLELLEETTGRRGMRGITFTPKSKYEVIDRLVWALEWSVLSMEPNLELIRELRHFEATHLESGHVRLGAASGMNDDLVIALALAITAFEKTRSAPILVGPQRSIHLL